MTINHILIVIAMEAEASPLIQHLNLKDEVISAFPASPHKTVTGFYKQVKITVVTNGKCSKFNVDNVGTTPG